MERAFGVPPEGKARPKTLAEQVAKLEADFQYENDHCQELTEEIAAKNRAVTELGEKVESQHRSIISLHKQLGGKEAFPWSWLWFVSFLLAALLKWIT